MEYRVASYMVIFTIVVDADTPADAVQRAVGEVPSSPADVWTIPDDLGDEPRLTRVEPPVDD